MPNYTHEGTETLKEIADEVVREREERGRSEFDVHATQASSEEADDDATEESFEDLAEDAPMGSVSRISRQNSPQ